MSNLRAQVIKLAQQNPELRPHLVPLLRTAAVKTWDSGFSDTAVAGDRRYQYVPFHKLTPVVQSQARGQYPHKSVGAAYDFLDEHYFYPVKQDGSLARAQRNLAIPLAKIKNRQYMDGLGYTLNPGWEGRVASDDRWERSIAASCMPRQAGCEKLPEGGMRDNCEKKVEEGKGKTAGVPDQHQLKILRDTVKNPLKGKFLGGPSAEEAEETLRKKFKYTDKQIEDLKKGDKGKTAANTDWLDDALQDLSKDYTATRSAFKPVNHARVNGKPITDSMIKDLKDALQEDLKEIKENGYATNGHKSGRPLFDKIQAWSKTLKPGKTASTRQAGYSFAEDTAWFAFIGNKTPFNVDVIEKINYTPLKFRDDDGKVQEDLGMRVSQPISYSPSLTRGLEMAGAVREAVFAVKYPRGALRQVQAALMAIGKALKFQVEYVPAPRKAQTRQKSR